MIIMIKKKIFYFLDLLYFMEIFRGVWVGVGCRMGFGMIDKISEFVFVRWGF